MIATALSVLLGIIFGTISLHGIWRALDNLNERVKKLESGK